MNLVGNGVVPNKQRTLHIALAALLIPAFALVAFADNPAREFTARARHDHKSTLRRLVSGPTQSLQGSLAGTVQPTAEVLLTPVANNPSGPYGHGGYYSDADISGQRLTVSSGGGRTFWNMQIRNWGSSKVRTYQGRPDAISFLGSIADCGGGPGSCDNAADLIPAVQSCASTPECIETFGEAVPGCSSGFCAFAWVASEHPDWIFANNFGSQRGCGLVDPAGPLCFAAIDDVNDSRTDDGRTYYAATFVLDVPVGAKGIYKLDWKLPEIDTFLGDDDTPPQNITLAATIPGELEIARGACCFDLGTGACEEGLYQVDCLSRPTTNDVVWRQGQPCDPLPCESCEQDADCDDSDACTIESCDIYCLRAPIPQWDPETMCCDPATGEVEEIPVLRPCFKTSCSKDGRVLVFQLPAGRVCNEGDPCIIGATCTEGGECVGTLDIGTNCPKPRYVTFTPIQTDGPSVIELTLVSLFHPSPPDPSNPQAVPPPDFSGFEGQKRWVGEPFDCSNSIGFGTLLKCATLTCSPVEFDFWSDLQGQSLHITGAAIVPSSVYDIAQFPENATGSDPPLHANYGVKTARWGDVAAPFQSPADTDVTQPSATDLASVIDRVRDLVDALDKPRVQLRGNIPDPHRSVGVVDVALAVDAIKGLGYPYDGPSPCNP